MAKLPLVKCRICKGEINRNVETDWIMPSRNWYYHEKCYKDWKKSTPTQDEQYISFIYDFISRDMKVQYDYHMCETQRKKYVNEKNMTNKGIFFTLKYFYELKGGDWEKGHGGLGIVPYVYNEACTYWVEQERKSKGIVAQIEAQMKKAAERDSKVIKKKEVKKKSKINLAIIEEMEDEE